jgi:hypothetical protein
MSNVKGSAFLASRAGITGTGELIGVAGYFHILIQKSTLKTKAPNLRQGMF